MKKFLLPQTTQYKANLHTHTTVSDGNSTPKQVKEFYKRHGYSIVAFTDHELLIDHSDLNDDSFLSITGCEYANTDKTDVPWKYKTTCHLNFLAKQPDNTTHVCYNPTPAARFVGEEAANNVKHHGDYFEREHTVECVNHIIKEANAHGFLVAMNHPWWSMEGFSTYSQYEGCFAVEIFNTTCSVMDGYYELNLNIYDELLRAGRMVYPIAADDLHHLKPEGDFQPEALGGFNMICSPSLCYNDVIGAISRGDMYASMGPIIDELYIEDGKISLKCSEAESVFFRTGTRRGKYCYNSNGSCVTECTFGVQEDDKYVYVCVKDKFGKWAITRAYTIDELL